MGREDEGEGNVVVFCGVVCGGETRRARHGKGRRGGGREQVVAVNR